MYRSVQRVRYPPFDHENSDPREIPLVEVILESETPPPPQFRIGNDNSWVLEWREERISEDSFPVIKKEVTSKILPFLSRTRDGWYIEPDPMHGYARKTIVPGVIVLIFALLIHALEPAIINLELVPDFIFSPVGIGPLDYPLMILISFPVFIIPIIIRVVANIMDIRRQNDYISNPLDDPEVEIIYDSKGGIAIEKFSLTEGTTAKRARIQVGIAVPERETILEAIGREKHGQPAPGMSTELPERRISTADEHGTGVGESVPMSVGRGRLLLLEPMRVQDSGSWAPMDNLPVALDRPMKKWPGTIYSAMIAVHWELVIEATRHNGTRMKWVMPLTMDSEDAPGFEELPVRSGRSES